jgi:hypothetical protein
MPVSCRHVVFWSFQRGNGAGRLQRDVSSFHKAFKLETGPYPIDYRNRFSLILWACHPKLARRMALPHPAIAEAAPARFGPR